MVTSASRLIYGAIIGGSIISALLPTPTLADIIIQGSTTFNARLLIPHQADIEALSKQSLTVLPNKSSLGLMALFDRRAALAMISSSLESEVATLRKTMPDLPFDKLHSFHIASTRIAFAINPANPVRSANLDTIRRILLGEIDNWKALGGPDLPIKVVKVREGGGVQASVEAELLAGRHMTPAHSIDVQIGSQVTKIVAQAPEALGLAQLGRLKEQNLSELLTDGVIEQQLNLITFGQPTPEIQSVINASRRVALIRLD